jgi:hypothetical protein
MPCWHRRQRDHYRYTEIADCDRNANKDDDYGAQNGGALYQISNVEVF